MAGARNQAKPISLFYSYSHKDEELRDRLEEHLGGLRRRRLIADWHDRRSELKDAIDEHLATADIILLLISSSFINSDYRYNEEMTKALERHAKGEARVIPVLLKPCYWQASPFARLQIVPRDAKPITSWPDPDQAFVEVVQAIHRAVDEIRLRRSHTVTPVSRPELASVSQPAISPTAPEEPLQPAGQAFGGVASAAAPAEEAPHPSAGASPSLTCAGEGRGGGVGRFYGVLRPGRAVVSGDGGAAGGRVHDGLARRGRGGGRRREAAAPRHDRLPVGDRAVSGNI
jgi:hypothetical protein